MQNPSPEDIPAHIWEIIHDRTVAMAVECGLAEDDASLALWAIVEAELEQHRRGEISLEPAQDQSRHLYRSPDGSHRMLLPTNGKGLPGFMIMNLPALE